jgi:hypothetical protein
MNKFHFKVLLPPPAIFFRETRDSLLHRKKSIMTTVQLSIPPHAALRRNQPVSYAAHEHDSAAVALGRRAQITENGI